MFLLQMRVLEPWQTLELDPPSDVLPSCFQIDVALAAVYPYLLPDSGHLGLLASLVHIYFNNVGMTGQWPGPATL